MGSTRPLAGLMKCGECGCAITFERKVKKSGREFRYLRCANGKKAHPSLVSVSEEEVFNGFSSAIASIAINTHLAEEIGAVLSESQNAVEATRKRDAARFQAELADLERREDQLYDDRVRGLLDDDGYRRQLARLRTQRTDAAKKVETANAELDDEWLSQRSAL